MVMVNFFLELIGIPRLREILTTELGLTQKSVKKSCSELAYEPKRGVQNKMLSSFRTNDFRPSLTLTRFFFSCEFSLYSASLAESGLIKLNLTCKIEKSVSLLGSNVCNYLLK